MEPTLLRIDRSATDPLYLQIVEQIRRLVASGSLAVGTPLPSVRAVARVHEINPMTVSKAYQQLVRDGLAQRRGGSALRILWPDSADLQARMTMIETDLRRTAQAAADLGLSRFEVLDRFDALLKELAC
jgi:GntR family transcriptional regulator